MDQIERIREMEDILHRAEEAIRALNGALDGYAALREEVARFSAYYGSDSWFFDLDSDRAGLLPAGLRRGVLSEDEPYDMLSGWAALREKLRALAELETE